jgi:plasmid stabilization system protein ParE
MTYTVVFWPDAQAQLVELYRYIAATSPTVAAHYTDDLVSYCESLRTFPLRGIKRDDVRRGLRITNFRRLLSLRLLLPTLLGVMVSDVVAEAQAYFAKAASLDCWIDFVEEVGWVVEEGL